MFTGRVSSAEFLIFSSSVQSPEIPFLEDETLWLEEGFTVLVDVVRKGLKCIEKQLPPSPRVSEQEHAVGAVL